jgi:hypothetical protein
MGLLKKLNMVEMTVLSQMHLTLSCPAKIIELSLKQNLPWHSEEYQVPPVSAQCLTDYKKFGENVSSPVSS